MPRLMAQDTHAPFVFATLHLEHLRLLELFEARMREIEGDGHGGGAVGRKPLVREVEVERRTEAANGELTPQLFDAVGERALDDERQVAHAHVEQCIVW